jgi:hypothetical protein
MKNNSCSDGEHLCHRWHTFLEDRLHLQSKGVDTGFSTTVQAPFASIITVLDRHAYLNLKMLLIPLIATFNAYTRHFH